MAAVVLVEKIDEYVKQKDAEDNEISDQLEEKNFNWFYNGGREDAMVERYLYEYERSFER